MVETLPTGQSRGFFESLFYDIQLNPKGLSLVHK
jgi:hypothetical protein